MQVNLPVSRDRRTLILIGVVAPLLALGFEEGLAVTAVPHAIAGLNGFNHYAWPSTAFLLASTIAMPVFAKLSDLYGRKRFYLLAAALCIGYSFFCGAAGTLPSLGGGMSQMVAATCLLGLAHGAVLVLPFSYVGDLYLPAERGKYQGLLAALVAVPFTVGPTIGGWICDHLSWRWAFYVNAPVCAAALAVAYWLIPDIRPKGVRPRIDWAGIVFLCGWLVPLLLALTWGAKTGWSAAPIPALLVVSAAALAAWLAIEACAIEPLVTLQLFRDRRVVLVSTSILLMGACVYGFPTYLPLVLQGVLHASGARAGTVFGQYVAAMVSANLAGGYLLTRVGPRRDLAFLGAGLSSAGLFLISRMDESTNLTAIAIGAMACGAGLGILMPLYEVLVQNAVSAERMGVATGSTQFFRAVGGSIGLAAFGAMLIGIYHAHVDQLLQSGTPVAFKQAFENPLQMALNPPNLHAAASQLADGDRMLRELLAASRAGLLAAAKSIFRLCAGIMAGSAVLSLSLPRAQRPKIAGPVLTVTDNVAAQEG